QGVFLPGGGIEAGETPEEAIVREALEECGLVIRAEVRPAVWTARAIQFVYSESEGTHFEKRSIFFPGFVYATDAAVSASAVETDHQLIWVPLHTATQMLSHESHGWAVEQWTKRLL